MSECTDSVTNSLRFEALRVVPMSQLAEILGAPNDKLIDAAEDADFSLDANMRCLVTPKQFVEDILEYAMDEYPSNFEDAEKSILARARQLLGDDPAVFVDLMM